MPRNKIKFKHISLQWSQIYITSECWKITYKNSTLHHKLLQTIKHVQCELVCTAYFINIKITSTQIADTNNLQSNQQKQHTSSTNLLMRSVNCVMRFSRAAICGVVGICKSHIATTTTLFNDPLSGQLGWAHTTEHSLTLSWSLFVLSSIFL